MTHDNSYTTVVDGRQSVNYLGVQQGETKGAGSPSKVHRRPQLRPEGRASTMPCRAASGKIRRDSMSQTRSAPSRHPVDALQSLIARFEPLARLGNVAWNEPARRARAEQNGLSGDSVALDSEILTIDETLGQQMWEFGQELREQRSSVDVWVRSQRGERTSKPDTGRADMGELLEGGGGLQSHLEFIREALTPALRLIEEIDLTLSPDEWGPDHFARMLGELRTAYRKVDEAHEAPGLGLDGDELVMEAELQIVALIALAEMAEGWPTRRPDAQGKLEYTAWALRWFARGVRRRFFGRRSGA